MANYSFKEMDVGTCEEVTTAPGFSIPQNVTINITSPCINQTAAFSFVKESMNTSASSEEHTAYIPIDDQPDCSKIATVPVIKPYEESMATDLSICRDSLPLHNSAHSMFALAPADIRHLIYKFAMTSDEGQFLFSDQREPFTPNVATGLLRVNRAIYHESRAYLYSQNTFFFTRCGSDLRIIFQPRDASRYGEAVSPLRTKMPVFNKVVFSLGDNFSPVLGEFKTEFFMIALCALRDDVQIRNLTILFGHECWEKNWGPVLFAKSLFKLKVTRSLEILGIDKYLLHDIRAIPRALGMNIQPVWSKLYPCDVGIDFRGIFTSTYVPAETPEEVSLRPDQTLIDAGVEYYARLMDSSHMVQQGLITLTDPIAQVPNYS